MVEAYLYRDVVRVLNWKGHAVVIIVKPFSDEYGGNADFTRGFIEKKDDVTSEIAYIHCTQKFPFFEGKTFALLRLNDEMIPRDNIYTKKDLMTLFTQLHRCRYDGKEFISTSDMVWVATPPSLSITGISEMDKMIDEYVKTDFELNRPSVLHY